MNPANFKLLFHHHTAAYTEDSDQIWLNAGIARWISALSDHFREIGLLLYHTSKHTPTQDTQITQQNVKFYSLGLPGHYWDHISRLHRIQQVCRAAGAQADGLLIRGLTPRQLTVWESTPIKNKAFLLVRSPTQNRLTSISLDAIFSSLINRVRESHFRKIARGDTLLMVNSPLHIPQAEEISGKTAHFIPTNTISRSEFSDLEIRPTSNPVQLLYCGRIHYLKGLRELFQAVAILRQQGQSCSLNLVGEQEEPASTQLKRLADQLGISNHIIWHGYISFGPELFKRYGTADMFVLPTYTEGFPRVYWEAASNCCPVIITAVGGIPALLNHEQHALLIPPKDPDAIAAAVTQLLSDHNLRCRMVLAAYDYASSYSVEACAWKLTDLLSEKWI
jgi:glycosyltransferase involved in cell wall biosynthesis